MKMELPFDIFSWSWASVVIALLLICYVVWTQNFKYWKNKGVEYLKPHLLFGNIKKLLFFQLSPGQFIADIYNRTPGLPYVGFYIFGRPAMVFRDPEILKNILVKDFNHFTDRHLETSATVDPMGAHSIFLLKEPKWRHMRANITPVFTSGKMKQMFGLVADCAVELRSYFGNNRPRVEDIKDLMAKYTTDVISSCAFGITSNCIKDPKSEFRQFGKNIFEFTTFRSLELMGIFFIPTLAKWARFSFFTKKTADFLRKAFWQTLNYRESNKFVRNDLIDQLISLRQKGNANTTKDGEKAPKFDYSGDEIVAQAALFFTAGFETTASTMTFTLWELAMNQEIQSKVRQEISEELKKTDGKITYDMIHSMKYLDMVVSETLRKYPPVPFLDRITINDYQIPGTKIVIEKGTPVFAPVLGLHHDPQYFPEPEVYDPERFNEVNKAKIPRFSYMPFGEGPRNCVGLRFGLMSAKTGIVHILSQSKLGPAEDTPRKLVIDPKGVITSATGCIPLSVESCT